MADDKLGKAEILIICFEISLLLREKNSSSFCNSHFFPKDFIFDEVKQKLPTVICNNYHCTQWILNQSCDMGINLITMAWVIL